MKRSVVPNWQKDVEMIRKMRNDVVAPVDTMGCHKLADPLAKPEVHRFQVLVALMLSSQTKDEVNAAAMKRLKDNGLSIENILEIEDEKLRNLLNPVGFYKRKTIYLKQASQILKDKYNGDIPDTFDGLCSLPGVGPKMANLVMQIAWQKTTGIAVDTHVHRISNRLGWIETKTPEKTMEQLEILLPKEEWQPINHLLVGFGQMICKPVNPKCEECLLDGTCPKIGVNLKKKKKTKHEKREKIEIKEEDDN